MYPCQAPKIHFQRPLWEHPKRRPLVIFFYFHLFENSGCGTISLEGVKRYFHWSFREFNFYSIYTFMSFDSSTSSLYLTSIYNERDWNNCSIEQKSYFICNQINKKTICQIMLTQKDIIQYLVFFQRKCWHEKIASTKILMWKKY